MTITLQLHLMRGWEDGKRTRKKEKSTRREEEGSPILWRTPKRWGNKKSFFSPTAAWPCDAAEQWSTTSRTDKGVGRGWDGKIKICVRVYVFIGFLVCSTVEWDPVPVECWKKKRDIKKNDIHARKQTNKQHMGIRSTRGDRKGNINKQKKKKKITLAYKHALASSFFFFAVEVTAVSQIYSGGIRLSWQREKARTNQCHWMERQERAEREEVVVRNHLSVDWLRDRNHTLRRNRSGTGGAWTKGVKWNQNGEDR